MNKTVSAIGGFFVIILVVVFIVTFRQGAGGPQTAAGPDWVADIHGTKIPAPHFWAAYRLITARGVDPNGLKRMGRSLRQTIADGLVERWLLGEEAKRLGITVSDDEVTAELASGRAYVSLPAEAQPTTLAGAFGLGWEAPFRLLRVKSPKTNVFDVKTYDKEIREKTRLSPADFREFEREEIIAARMRDLIRSRVHVAEAEAYGEYSRVKSTATISYIKLDESFYADLAVDKSQKAVDEWAAKNADEINKAWESRKSEYKDECRVARHILAKADEDASDEQKAKAKKRIDKALELISKGEDFADVARRFSEDSSAAEGGDLGCASHGKMVEPFDKAMFALEEGKVSPIVTTKFGYHIIKLEKIAKGDAMEKVVKAEIARELYVKHASEERAAAAAKSILAAAKGGKSLDDALKTHLDELAASLSPKDDKGAKKDEKKDEKADDKKADDKKAEDEIVENKVFTIETHPDRPLVQASAPFNISGDPIPEAVASVELVKQAFALQKPGDLLNDVVQLRGGYAVVALKEKQPVKQEDWEKDRDQIMTAIRKAKQAEALVGYIQRLRSKAGAEVPIKFNKDLVTEPKEEKGQGSEPEPDPEDPGE